MIINDADLIGPPMRPSARIIKLVPKFPAHAEPFSPRGEDDSLFRDVADWHVHRARAEMHWAEGHFGLEFTEERGTGSTQALPEMDKMHGLEAKIIRYAPQTLGGAIAMLQMAMTIVAAQTIDPHSSMSSGPVLDLVRLACDCIETEETDQFCKSVKP